MNYLISLVDILLDFFFDIPEPVDAKVIVYMLVSGGREPFWDGSDIRAIKNTLKKEVAIPLPE